MVSYAQDTNPQLYMYVYLGVNHTELGCGMKRDVILKEPRTLVMVNVSLPQDFSAAKPLGVANFSKVQNFK